MSNAAKILPHYTYEDHEHWEGQWELIDGIPYAMSPAPVPKHQRLSANLISEFRQQLKMCTACQVYQPIDYVVADDTILQPDMLIVCKEITKKFLDFPPALVTEILSPATAAKDRFSKFPIYQSKQIPYYLIIDPDLEEVEIYELTNGQYKLIQRGKDTSYDFSLEACTAQINFGEIWK
jgi:Uma2 family endonuclease